MCRLPSEAGKRPAQAKALRATAGEPAVVEREATCVKEDTDRATTRVDEGGNMMTTSACFFASLGIIAPLVL